MLLTFLFAGSGLLGVQRPSHPPTSIRGHWPESRRWLAISQHISFSASTLPLPPSHHMPSSSSTPQRTLQVDSYTGKCWLRWTRGPSAVTEALTTGSAFPQVEAALQIAHVEQPLTVSSAAKGSVFASMTPVRFRRASASHLSSTRPQQDRAELNRFLGAFIQGADVERREWGSEKAVQVALECVGCNHNLSSVDARQRRPECAFHERAARPEGFKIGDTPRDVTGLQVFVHAERRPLCEADTFVLDFHVDPLIEWLRQPLALWSMASWTSDDIVLLSYHVKALIASSPPKPIQLRDLNECLLGCSLLYPKV